MLQRRVLPIALLAVTAVATVVAFWTFDRESHSARDTIRPFLITMVPVWLIVGVAVQHLTRTHRRKKPAADGFDQRRRSA